VDPDLDELRLGGERNMAGDEVKALVRDEHIHLLEEDVTELPTFFGQPVTSAEPAQSGARDRDTVKSPKRKRRSART